MGSVYSVEDLALQTRVTLKVVHRELLESEHYQHRFIEEARQCIFDTSQYSTHTPDGTIRRWTTIFYDAGNQGFSLRDAIKSIYRIKKKKCQNDIKAGYEITRAFRVSRRRMESTSLDRSISQVCEAMAYVHSRM